MAETLQSIKEYADRLQGLAEKMYWFSVSEIYPTRFEIKALGTEDEARAYLAKRGNAISE